MTCRKITYSDPGSDRPHDLACPHCGGAMQSLRDIVDLRRSAGSSVTECEHCERAVVVRWETHIEFTGVAIDTNPTQRGPALPKDGGASCLPDTTNERVDSIGTCAICGYYGPGPRHDCAARRCHVSPS